MSKQQEFISELEIAIKQKEPEIISEICQQIKDNDLLISPDFNIENETTEIIGDIDIDSNATYEIVDINEIICICKVRSEYIVNFRVKIEGYDGNTASYDEDDVHYTDNVRIEANVQRKLPVIIKAYYRRDANDELYIDNYRLEIKPITIECTDYDEDYYRQK